MRHVWGTGEVRTEYWCADLREGGHLYHLGLDGRIILEWIFKKWYGSMDWTALTQDRYSWQANAVMTLWVPYNAGDFLD